MLKILSPTSSCGSAYIKSKCAEIHYQTSDFSILCIVCGMSTLVYSEFLEHFQSQHFESFTNGLHDTVEPTVTNLLEDSSTFKRINHDPLELGEREVTGDPDEAMKILEASRYELKESNIAVQNYRYDSTEIELQEKATIQHKQKELHKCVDQSLVCKIKIEDANLTSSLIEDLNITISANTDSYSSDNSITPTGADVDADCDANIIVNANADEDADGGNEEVDWSKPYEPYLLKNHDKRPYKPRNKPNICTYCGRTFRRRYQLDTHLNIHTGLKPHQCEICGRQFRAITTLTRHLNTHEQRDAHHCKYCTKLFTHRAALLSHELRHTQQRRIPCDECDKYFYTVNQMDTHKRKVHHKADDNDLPFACELCMKRYRSASMLSTHKFKKHYKTAKIFCEQCGKKFIDEIHLEAHKVIHVSNINKF